MTTTVHRPVPLPPRPGQTATAPGQQRRQPLPAGAVAWSRTYLDTSGCPQTAGYDVPVDADGRRTAHVRHVCRGKVETTTRHADGTTTVTVEPDAVEWLLPGDDARYCPNHGVQLEPDGQRDRKPLLPWPQMWRAVEGPAKPWWILAAQLAAGIGEHAAGVPWWAPASAAPLLAGGAYVGTSEYLTRRAVRNRKLEPGQKTGRRVDTIRRRARAAAYTAAASGGWLTLAAATDPGDQAGAAMWAGGLAAQLAACAPMWWRYLAGQRNRPQPEPETPPPGPVPVEPSADELSAAEAAATWTAEVGIAGTELDVTTWRKIACGWQAVVVATKRGALNNLGADNMKATIRRIASAFDVPKSAVTWIEEYDDSPNRALLLIQPNNPLKDGQIWSGPDSIAITGSRIEAEVGRMIDGSAMVEVLYRFGWGAPSEVGLGTTGGGKSMRVRKKLIIERWASYEDHATGQRRGLFLSFLHDPKRLESYAEFRNAVHGYGITRDDAHLMIDAFLREMIRRYDMLALKEWEDAKGRRRAGGVPFDPRTHGPIISCYWDEFHELATDAEFVKKLEKLARYQRACGMRAGVFSHMATLGDTGSQALRDMLAGGRATLFRTTSGLNASLATGGQLTADPRGLPKTPGMCLVADGETATLMGRESYIPNDADADALGERSLYDWLFDDDNQPIGYPAGIPAETADAFGPEFMEWMEAGRRDGGRDEPAVRRAAAKAAAAAEVKGADDALRRILFDAGRPLDRKEILAHPLWTCTASQLGKSLTALTRAGEVCGPHGKHELTAQARARMQAERDEAGE